MGSAAACCLKLRSTIDEGGVIGTGRTRTDDEVLALSVSIGFPVCIENKTGVTATGNGTTENPLPLEVMGRGTVLS